MDVLVVTVNEEETLLAFAKKELVDSKNVYKSWLVVLGSGKLFELHIETSHIQYLLFLPWKNAKEAGKRKGHLLFFMEKKDLGILHVTTTVQSSTSKVEVQGIAKEIIVQHYVWYQIDLMNMRLYYIYLHQNVSSGVVKSCRSVLNILQFSCYRPPHLILVGEIPLPIRYSWGPGIKLFY